jgi:FkbM family methyltransferase
MNQYGFHWRIPLEYDESIYLREEQVCGVSPWWWRIGDTGAWDGPHKEFEQLKFKMLSKAKARNTIVQAGGCMGLYPRLWADVFKEVWTFEPDPLSFHCLVRNCQNQNIRKYNAALGQKGGTIWLTNLNETNVGMHRVSVTETSSGLKVQLLALDDFNLESCDALQLDVEGFEYDVLIGAKRTIETFKPVVSVEAPNSNVTKFLTERGYKEFDRNYADRLFWCEG